MTAGHTVLGMLKVSNQKLVWSNLLLLLVVAFMPFPTAIVSHYVQLRVGIGVYTAWLVLLGLLNRRLIKVASSARRRYCRHDHSGAGALCAGRRQPGDLLDREPVSQQKRLTC